MPRRHRARAAGDWKRYSWALSSLLSSLKATRLASCGFIAATSRGPPIICTGSPTPDGWVQSRSRDVEAMLHGSSVHGAHPSTVIEATKARCSKGVSIKRSLRGGVYRMITSRTKRTGFQAIYNIPKRRANVQTGAPRAPFKACCVYIVLYLINLYTSTFQWVSHGICPTLLVDSIGHPLQVQSRHLK